MSDTRVVIVADPRAGGVSGTGKEACCGCRDSDDGRRWLWMSQSGAFEDHRLLAVVNGGPMVVGTQPADRWKDAGDPDVVGQKIGWQCGAARPIEVEVEVAGLQNVGVHGFASSID